MPVASTAAGTACDPDRVRVEIGDTLAGRYRIVQRLEDKDDARFWVAEDEASPTPGFRVNVRLPHDPDVIAERDRLRHEAHIMSAVRRPYVVRVLDVTEDHDVPLLVTEDVTGERLSAVAAGAAIKAPRAVEHALQMIDGLVAMGNIAGRDSTVIHRSAEILDERRLIITGIRVDPRPPDRADPAVKEVGLVLQGMLGNAVGTDAVDQFISPTVASAALRNVITRAINGQIDTLDELRRQLTHAMDERAQRRRRFQWIAVIVAAAFFLLFLAIGLATCGSDDSSGRGGGGGGGTVTVLRAADVPNLIGMDEGTARDTLERAGFSVLILQRPHGGTPKGEVFAQVPTADTRTARGSRVVVKVSTGPVPIVVPDVRWVPLRTARAMLHRAGFRIGHLSERGAQGPPGRVVGQNPPPGRKAEPGTEVRLVLDAN